jgi:hypothetical protein
LDCTALRARIAAFDTKAAAQPNPHAAAARKQRAELDRTAAYARSLGCNQPEIPLFGPPLPARCPGLNAKIAQMQANLGQLEAAATSRTDRARADLIARYDAYCRAPIQTRQHAAPQNFFEAILGAFAPAQPVPPPTAPWAPPMDESPDVAPDTSPRGGSQAVCVRTCDGGFFPLDISARHADPAYLDELCQALCPNAEAKVYTRAPHSDIERAVALDDGTHYSDLPHALAFRTSTDAACTCKPPHQSWVEALAGAEQIRGAGRRGDILVTPESSAQMSRARPEPRAKDALGGHVDPDRRPPLVAAPGRAPTTDAADATPSPAQVDTKEMIGPDGVKRRVRIIAPTL